MVLITWRTAVDHHPSDCCDCVQMRGVERVGEHRRQFRETLAASTWTHIASVREMQVLYSGFGFYYCGLGWRGVGQGQRC